MTMSNFSNAHTLKPLGHPNGIIIYYPVARFKQDLNLSLVCSLVSIIINNKVHTVTSVMMTWTELREKPKENTLELA